MDFKHVIFSLFLICSLSTHAESSDRAKANDKLFRINNQVVNPKCIELLQTPLAELASIMTQSVVIETCHDSKFASNGQQYEISSTGRVTYQDDPNDPHSVFFYEYLGKTKQGLIALFHEGTIGIYEVTKKVLNFDMSHPVARRVHLLSKIGHAFVPCFENAKIIGTKLLITKAVFAPNEPTVGQCTEKLEHIEIDTAGWANHVR